MSSEVQRVVVIQDASRDVSLNEIRWALKGLSLKPGDVITLVGVLHQVNNPCTLSFIRPRKLSKRFCFSFSLFFVTRKYKP